jgi:DNA-binding beta-propeller fold protein YncE
VLWDEVRGGFQKGKDARLMTAAGILLEMTLLLVAVSSLPARGQIMLSGNENKIDLTTGGQTVIPNAAPDSLTLIDFSKFPPVTVDVMNVPNTVIGPPSNIAISPDGRLALVANSIRIDPPGGEKYVPESYVHVIDLSVRPPRVVARVTTDLQPSGVSFTPDGKLALVANRASGTISVLGIDGTNVRLAQSVKVCEPADQVCDVAVSPDGKLALASVRMGSYLALLHIENGTVTATGRKISAFGQAYRVVITPDGDLGLTAGSGFGNGSDVDAVSVIDLKAAQPRTIDYIPIGVAPESIEISPDGKLLAAVVIEGSNQPKDDPRHSQAGALVILSRKDRSFVKTQRLAVGRIPEGVAFTSDGKHLVVQCHPDRELRIFEVNGGIVTDTGQRIKVPGMPSSLRAAPAK